MKKQGAVIGLMVVLIIVGLSGCINVPEELTQMSIISFNVEPGLLNQGESANISWVVISASAITIDNGIGTVALTGHRMIQPTQTTTYTLTASNATTTRTATVTVTVNNESSQPEKTFLTISVGSQLYNYSLTDLTELDAVSGEGSYINKIGKITGPNTYTGVTVNVLLESIPSLPSNYTFRAIASDGYERNFSSDELNGYVPVFNETGGELGLSNLTMIIGYKENGVFLNETTKGPLRIAFIDDVPSLTNSGLWLSSLVKIEIIAE
ncbi:MAG: hypothetical protein JW840_06915 [Candidatus Thermoplasmatota archaeon]|nr:hypothetical protein [Candidatus Thermoplasmatota archaeon]